MENASKALIIAGSVLISIIIISLGVFVFRNLSKPVIEDSTLDQQEVATFNSRIRSFLGENVSGSDVNTLIQRARTINQNSITKNDTARRITINYNGNEVLNKDKSKLTEATGTNKGNVLTGKYYKVKGTQDSNGLITLIEIED